MKRNGAGKEKRICLIPDTNLLLSHFNCSQPCILATLTDSRAPCLPELAGLPKSISGISQS